MDDFILDKVGSDLAGALVLGVAFLVFLPFFWIAFKVFDKAKIDTTSEGGSFALVVFVIVLVLLATPFIQKLWGE